MLYTFFFLLPTTFYGNEVLADCEIMVKSGVNVFSNWKGKGTTGYS